jgi:hypothetical protein
MESATKSKIIFLLSGIIVGLAVSFVMTLTSNSNTSVALQKEQIKESALSNFTDKLLHIFSLNKDSVKVDTVEKIITINNITQPSYAASIVDTTSSPNDTLNNNYETIRKDELLETRLIEISSNKINKVNANDSLLADVANVPASASNVLRTITVEYWQSPINYKGYKMTANKLIIFGLSPDEPLSITELNNDVFLKHANNVYKIVLTTDYKSLERM